MFLNERQIMATMNRFIHGVKGRQGASLLVLATSLLVSPVWARIGDTPKAWTIVDGNWVTYSYNGSAVRDPINSGGSSDPSVGASPNNPVDIASGTWSGVGNKYDTCNPPTTSGECGSAASAFFYYYNNNTPGNSADDTLFLRMRVQQDPRDSQNKDFQNFHWNYLLSYLADTPNPAYPNGPTEYKEFWLDLAGGSASNLSGSKASALRVIYENNNSNTLTTSAFGANGTGLTSPNCPRSISASNGTIVDSFIACTLSGVTSGDGDCGSADNVTHSFTRVVAVGDGTNQFYIDLQVPVSSLTDNCGTYVVPTSTTGTGSTDTRTAGNQVINENTSVQYAYSTSNSNQDPLQKDFIGYGGCSSDNGTTCKVTFGDPITTPVTLSSFRASSQGASVLFKWSTATEVGNVGFNLYTEVDGARTRINADLIPSKVVNSLARQTYSYTAGSATSDVFWIEDVDIKGKTQSYGPFVLGESYGDNSIPDPIQWGNIRAQHASARAQIQRQRLTAWKRYDYPRVNFRVTQQGIYRVTYEDLIAAGVNLAGVPENKLALINRGQSAPIYVSAKGAFGSGDWIEFYGEPSTSLYTDVNVYQLQVDGSKALRLRDDPKPPRKNETPEAFYMETATWDENHGYAFYSPTDDPWYNTELFSGPDRAASKTFILPVDNYVSNQGAVTLGVSVWGGIYAHHHLAIGLNGASLGDANFDGVTAKSLQVSVPANVLRSGDNKLTLTLPGDTGYYDIVDIDRYSLSYPRAFVAKNDLLLFASTGKQFQVDGLSSPSVVVHRQESNGQRVRLREVTVSQKGTSYSATFAGTGQPARYVIAGATRTPEIEVASADLNLASDRAQLLIITHPDFINGLQDLVTRRQTKYQVKVADVDAVYDQFGDGTVDPAAIQRYIRYAVEKLGTQYVLLVGGDSYDYKNYLGVGSMSFIPSLYTATDELVRHAPVDPLLTDVNGDGVPDVPIGRLPVRTSAELQALSSKIGQYESKTYTKMAVLAADKDFSADADAFAATLPDGWSVDRAYLDHMSADQAKALINARVNAGSALLGFVGHSGPTLWTYKGLFNTNDVLKLGNSGKPTLVSQWGCWNTYYVEPNYNSMAQSFLVTGTQGAAAVLGATTLTQDSSERMLGTALTPLLAQPGMTIGDALQQAKRQVAAQNPSARDILLGWTILGDPTQVVTP